MEMSCACFNPTLFPLHIRTLDLAAAGATLNVFSNDAVWVENRMHHLPDDERMLYVLLYTYPVAGLTYGHNQYHPCLEYD